MPPPLDHKSFDSGGTALPFVPVIREVISAVPTPAFRHPAYPSRSAAAVRLSLYYYITLFATHAAHFLPADKLWSPQTPLREGNKSSSKNLAKMT